MKIIKLLFILLACYCSTQAQELNAKVTVVSSQISTTTDKRVFNTLQQALTNFLNNRKWTGENFKNNERIECAFILTLNREIDKNVYGASLQVQSARPVYNSTYNSPLVNYKDDDVVFKYIENQPVEFNENRVAGNDALVSNLTAVLAYYVDLIIGMDYSSFSHSSGDVYFKKMLSIVNNAPDGRDIKGWTQFDGLRNRYWLAENLTNTRYILMNEVFYNYYRSALDSWYDNEQQARQQMINVLNTLNQFVAENRNTMVLQVFMSGKYDELIKMFRKSPPDERSRVLAILEKVDITHAENYRNGLK